MPNAVIAVEGFLESTGLQPLAATALSGHRLVVPVGDGTVTYADASTLAHLHRPVWITTAAASMGAPVQVVSFGQVIEPTWSWTPGAALYLGLAGAITATIPTSSTAAFLLQIGSAVSATEIHFDPSVLMKLV